MEDGSVTRFVQYVAPEMIEADGDFFDIENARAWVIKDDFMRFWMRKKAQERTSLSRPPSSPLFPSTSHETPFEDVPDLELGETEPGGQDEPRVDR